ncbi:MAG TPA: hypothetical protein DDX89_01005 [Candidatus Omnitrophica bacterium]|nr:hypothetical protein [Candidatus Omnitrophota bacterium]
MSYLGELIGRAYDDGSSRAAPADAELKALQENLQIARATADSLATLVERLTKRVGELNQSNATNLRAAIELQDRLQKVEAKLEEAEKERDELSRGLKAVCKENSETRAALAHQKDVGAERMPRRMDGSVPPGTRTGHTPDGIPSCREPMLLIDGKAGCVLQSHCTRLIP